MNFIVNLIKNKRKAGQWMKVHKSGGSYGSYGSYGSFNFGFKPSNLCFLILDKEIVLSHEHLIQSGLIKSRRNLI